MNDEKATTKGSRTSRRTRTRTTSGAVQPLLMIVNLAEQGPPLVAEEMVGAIRGGGSNAMFRTVTQLLMLQMGIARGHELVPKHESREYFAGQAKGAEEVIVWLRELERGVVPMVVSSYFPAPTAEG